MFVWVAVAEQNCKLKSRSVQLRELILQCNPQCIESETNVTSLANKFLRENITVARSPSGLVPRRAARSLQNWKSYSKRKKKVEWLIKNDARQKQLKSFGAIRSAHNIRSWLPICGFSFMTCSCIKGQVSKG